MALSHALLEKLPLFLLAGIGCLVTVIPQSHLGATKSLQDVLMNLRLSYSAVACVPTPDHGLKLALAPDDVQLTDRARVPIFHLIIYSGEQGDGEASQELGELDSAAANDLGGQLILP